MIIVKKVALWTLVVSLFLSLFVLYTPKPKMSDGSFSAVRALEHIEVISREPHSVFDPVAHEAVRQYIKNTLIDYVGAGNVTEYNYTKEELNEGTEYDIQNVLGVIPGETEVGIMLVGHYDSRGHIGRYGELGRSYGAADDGYALGTMLEIAYLYKDANPKNSIYFLFTDAEETGLYGARMISTETELMDKIGFIINIEARGVSGAAYMFETSSNNLKVIDFYRKANLPVSYSLATAVYQVMPNYTDFTEFLSIDKQGINFAVLEGLSHYHTPLDNYLEVHVSSIQHYGEQIEPLVKTYAMDEAYGDVDYFVSNQDAVFFTLFANVFVSYSETLANIMHIVTLLLFIGLVVWLYRQKAVEPGKVLHYTTRFLLVFVGFIVVAYGFAQLMALFGRTPFSLTYVRMNGSELPTLLFMILLIGIGYQYYTVKVNTLEKMRAFLIFGIAFHLLLALITGFVLSGASFLFFVPSLLGVVSLYVSKTDYVWVKHGVYGLTTVVSILLIVPILYSFFLALTVGGTPILVALLFIHLTVLLPVFKLHLGLSN
ncbi:M28 family peptidase [Paracholeplasma manati]|uniref:Vacuolar membrane protease n=1 Tax=Paracholeplasma manati TaxID=591373 RepID=A0ABT2Y6G6_9MOLU|nr:M28 family peptidase [Paracholeplasma manati]MCV2232331.1 M28 family peptidase [Paracholeplasma manati]MDG0888288.1 M28 family peptidase [Paracholeplasma manati]